MGSSSATGSPTMIEMVIQYLYRRAEEGTQNADKRVTCSALDLKIAGDEVAALQAEVEHLRREVAACEREITREGQKVADARDDVMRAEQALALAEHRSAKREAALMAQHEQAMAIARAVAFDDPIQPDSGGFVCYYCCACAPYESAVVHGEHCTYEQARALLAADASAAE